VEWRPPPFGRRHRPNSSFSRPTAPTSIPSKQVIAKLKTLLRKASERTIEATWKRIGANLQDFTPQECANYFRNAGYGSRRSAADRGTTAAATTRASMKRSMSRVHEQATGGMRPHANETSQISSSTIVRAELLVAIHTSRQSCSKAGKAQIFALVWDSSVESRLRITMRLASRR
jgi:hypothetical protein